MPDWADEVNDAVAGGELPAISADEVAAAGVDAATKLSEAAAESGIVGSAAPAA